MRNARRHESRVVIVTGGSAGIGRSVAEVFAEEGASVVVVGFTESNVDETVSAIVRSGGEAIGLFGDVAKSGTHRRAVALAVAQFGRVDHLVTSAGVQGYGDAASTRPRDLDHLYQVNIRGTFLAVHAAIGDIRKNRGTVTLISSVQSIATQSNVVGYTMTKGALNAMARALAVDEAAFGVRVNSVLPGSIDTPMLRDAALRWSDGTAEGQDALIAEWGSMHPLGRVGQPREEARVSTFLASDEASFVTGAAVRVDGGLLARLAAVLPKSDE